MNLRSVLVFVAVVLADVAITTWLVDSLISAMDDALRDTVGNVNERNFRRSTNEPQELYTYSIEKSYWFGTYVAAICLPTIVSISFLNPYTTAWAVALPIMIWLTVGSLTVSLDMIAVALQQTIQSWLKAVSITGLVFVWVSSVATTLFVVHLAWGDGIRKIDDYFKQQVVRRRAEDELATEEEKRKLREQMKLTDV